MAPIANLFDDFNDGVIDTTKWTVLSGSWSEATGTMCSATSAGGFADMRSTSSWSLHQSSAFLELTNMTGGAGASYVEFRFRIRNSADATDRVEITVTPIANQIQFAWYENNVLQTSSTITWNSTTMRWIRIREVGGTVYFETAPDGVNWTQRFTSVAQTWVSSTQAYFSTFQTGGAAGTACFDNFNVASASARAVAVGSEFTVSADGKLGINRCDQTDSSWGYPCSESAYNALRRSENPCGLWVQPTPKQYLDVEAVNVSTTDEERKIITLALTNPDPCRYMFFYLPLTAGMRFTLAPTDDGSGHPVTSWSLGVQVTGVDNSDDSYTTLIAGDYHIPGTHLWRGVADYFWTAPPGATTTVVVSLKTFKGGGAPGAISGYQARLGIVGWSEVAA